MDGRSIAIPKDTIDSFNTLTTIFNFLNCQTGVSVHKLLVDG